jgi:hypothetical protein
VRRNGNDATAAETVIDLGCKRRLINYLRRQCGARSDRSPRFTKRSTRTETVDETFQQPRTMSIEK